MEELSGDLFPPFGAFPNSLKLIDGNDGRSVLQTFAGYVLQKRSSISVFNLFFKLCGCQIKTLSPPDDDFLPTKKVFFFSIWQCTVLIASRLRLQHGMR